MLAAVLGFSLLLRLPGQVLGEAREGYSSSAPPAPSSSTHANIDTRSPASRAVVRLGKTLKKIIHMLICLYCRN